MEPKFVTLPEMKVAGLSTRFIQILSPDANNQPVVPTLWREFLKRLSELRGRRNLSVTLGICIPIPEAERKHPDEWRYLAGSEVEKGSPLPSGMELVTIPSGRYAVFTHRGRLESLPHTYNYIHGAWFPRCRATLRDALDFELYDERFKPESDDSELDIYIPVR
jgi:AraC family transcriptional regulator